MNDFIRIEKVSIPTWPGKSEFLYFVDIATRMDDGHISTGNLRSFKTIDDALTFARGYGLTIENRAA